MLNRVPRVPRQTPAQRRCRERHGAAASAHAHTDGNHYTSASRQKCVACERHSEKQSTLALIWGCFFNRKVMQISKTWYYYSRLLITCTFLSFLVLCTIYWMWVTVWKSIWKNIRLCVTVITLYFVRDSWDITQYFRVNFLTDIFFHNYFFNVLLNCWPTAESNGGKLKYTLI